MSPGLSEEGASPPRHVLHVGYAKAGATFFKAWCASRDDVAFAPGALGGYCTTGDLLDGLAAGRPRLAVTSDEMLVTGVGPRVREAWLRRSLPADVPATASTEREHQRAATRRLQRDAQRAACAALHELFPTATVLILVRGFASALASMAAQAIKRGRLPHPATAERERSLAWKAGELDYDFVIGLYERAFGAERVVVLPYELLRDDTQAFVRALCRVGGVPYRPFDPGRVNASPPAHALGLLARWSPPVNRGIGRLPAPLVRPAQRTFERMLRRVHSAPWADRLGRALRVAPLPEGLYTEAAVRVAMAGQADATARRPEVAPYAAAYFVDS